MLKKLSSKFTAVGVAALFCVELVMIGLINGLNVYYTLDEVDDVTTLIIENKGEIPTKQSDTETGGRGMGRFPEMERRDKEMQYVTRYFTVEILSDGSAGRADTDKIATVTNEEAKEYALAAAATEKAKGFIDGYNFRYTISQNSDGGAMAVFYDFSEKGSSIERMIEISLVIAFVLLVIFSLIILLFSKRAVRPVMQSIQNQYRFITDAGHELKTPLAIIRADAEVLDMTCGESEWTKSIVNQTDRLSELVSQMLTLAKSQEAAKATFKKLDISEMFEQIASGFEPLFSTQGKRLAVEIVSGIEVRGDRNMFSTLLSVLLQNAVKYSSEGTDVLVKLATVGGKAVLTVTNQCDEPPKGDTRLLFERFYREDSSRTRETGGSGIGLSIAKSICDIHGGKIVCKVDGNTVTFTVKLSKE